MVMEWRNENVWGLYMKQLLCGAAVAAGLCLVAGAANAVTYTEVDYNGSNQAPLFGTPAPLTSTPKFDLIQSGTDSGVERSPYETNTDTTTAYSVLAKGGQAGPATATYGISNTATSFEILWGSPDSYNTVEFFTSSDGSGSAFYSVSGNSLTCTQTGHACLDTDGTTPIGWADVTFTFNG